jgi:TRAP-type mannitol/chloroaromatic compound transport system substrate-binding protein
MKQKIYVLALTMFIAGILFTACNSSDKKSANKQDTLTVEQKTIKQSMRDSVVQLEKRTEEIVNANEKNISDLKDKLANQNMEVKTKYEKKLEELDQKNSDLKIKLEEYKEDGTDKFEKFKTEYLNEIDEIGKSIKDLTAKIVK